MDAEEARRRYRPLIRLPDISRQRLLEHLFDVADRKFKLRFPWVR
jgi:hypothetical protein